MKVVPLFGKPMMAKSNNQEMSPIIFPFFGWIRESIGGMENFIAVLLATTEVLLATRIWAMCDDGGGLSTVTL